MISAANVRNVWMPALSTRSREPSSATMRDERPDYVQRCVEPIGMGRGAYAVVTCAACALPSVPRHIHGTDDGDTPCERTETENRH